ncbi:MAG: zinc-ribbon domain-containing protein [Thermodesulfobacteriota bacterium]
MEISCPGCQKRFLVPDEKLPANTKVVLTCPDCKGKIPIDTRGKSEEIGSLPDTDQDVAIEFFEEGTKAGLVCVPDESMKEGVVRVLEGLDYKTSVADDLRTFYAKVRYNHYGVMVVSEKSAEGGTGNNPILRYLDRLPISVRRNIFLLLISAQYRTLDTLMAFSLSVDAIINEKDLGEMREILQKSLSQHEHFYKVFKDCLRAEGRI